MQNAEHLCHLVLQSAPQKIAEIVQQPPTLSDDNLECEM